MENKPTKEQLFKDLAEANIESLRKTLSNLSTNDIKDIYGGNEKGGFWEHLKAIGEANPARAKTILSMSVHDTRRKQPGELRFGIPMGLTIKTSTAEPQASTSPHFDRARQVPKSSLSGPSDHIRPQQQKPAAPPIVSRPIDIIRTVISSLSQRHDKQISGSLLEEMKQSETKDLLNELFRVINTIANAPTAITTLEKSDAILDAILSIAQGRNESVYDIYSQMHPTQKESMRKALDALQANNCDFREKYKASYGHVMPIHFIRISWPFAQAQNDNGRMFSECLTHAQWREMMASAYHYVGPDKDHGMPLPGQCRLLFHPRTQNEVLRDQPLKTTPLQIWAKLLSAYYAHESKEHVEVFVNIKVQVIGLLFQIRPLEDIRAAFEAKGEDGRSALDEFASTPVLKPIFDKIQACLENKERPLDKREIINNLLERSAGPTH